MYFCPLRRTIKEDNQRIECINGSVKFRRIPIALLNMLV